MSPAPTKLSHLRRPRATIGKWIFSPWEDDIKGSGEVHCQWVLREFASTAGDSRYYAAAPDKTAPEMLHAHPMQAEHDLVYFDLSTAFMQAPETRLVYTSPAVGCSDPKKEAWLLVRKIKGCRDCSHELVEWFAKMAENELG